MKSKVALVKCNSYDHNLVYRSIKKALGLLGGIENFIKPNSRVLVKPNLLSAVYPEMAITTHPEVVRATVRILKQINCEIFLGDSPSPWSEVKDPWIVYEKTGMLTIAEEENINLVQFDKSLWKEKFPLTKWLDECDYFVSLPKFKTHDLTILTAAVKNLYGLICGLYKVELHKRFYNLYDFVNILLDLYELAKPQLTIIDGIVSLEGDGPASGGKPKHTGFILAGCDCIALDSILAVIMGLDPLDIPTNRQAEKRNLGEVRLSNIHILGDELKEVICHSFRLPTPSLTKRIPQPLVSILKKFLHFFPYIDYNKCISCGACLNICPVRAITFKNNRIDINYHKCINCFCCQETCLYSAVKVKKSILVKLLKL